MPGNGATHWTTYRHRSRIKLDYRRFVIIELAKQSGLHEDMALYYTRLKGWEKTKSGVDRGHFGLLSLNQFFCLVACTEWRDLTTEEALLVAAAAGLPTDGKPYTLGRK